MKNKKLIISACIGITLVILGWFFFYKPVSIAETTVKPKKGLFRVTVTTGGELKAKNSIEVRGPAGAERLGIYNMKISKIVPEGTIVKPGDIVAELDRSEIMAKIKEMDLQIQKNESQFLQAKLDSSLNLSSSRSDIENMKFSLEEKRLTKEQSIYEAPSVLRQAELAYERELRSYDQSIKNYGTKVQQAIAKLQEVGADLSMEKQNMAKIMETFEQFTIKAPAEGMVIYIRDWNGSKKVEGSVVNSWYPVVASLPDLNNMQSITYVNEIDIQKVKAQQYVNISLDANPNKKLSGIIDKVANIGEERKNSDSKVFEVIITVTTKDTTLLPSMTTSNQILVEEYKNVVFIPLETVHTEEKGGKKLTYAFKKEGSKIVKQELELGAMNENEVIVKNGVYENDDILITVPDKPEKLNVVYLKKNTNKQ